MTENYDVFATKFLDVVHEIREKSEDNIGDAKKRSELLYKEIISRIKAKELQIKTEMKMIQGEAES